MSGNPVASPSQITSGQVRLAQNSKGDNDLWSFIIAQAECNQIGEINKEFDALKEGLRTGPGTALYSKFKALTEQLTNKVYSCEDRYLQLESLPSENGISISKITFNPAALDADLKSFLAVLPLFAPAQQQEILEVANRQILQPNLNQVEVSQHIGKRMIQALHRKASPENSQKLWENLQAGMQLFAGLPFRLGPRGNYVKTSGHLSGEGIECISYANILVNLVSGIKEFSPSVGGMTGPDMFSRKPEFVKAGIRPSPSINRLKMDAASADDVVRVLEEYGELFVVQIYHLGGDPYHIVMVYKDRADGKFKITEAEIGTQVVYGKDFISWYEKKKPVFGFLTFNLIDPSKVQDFASGKSVDFMTNLSADIERAKP